MNRNVYLEQVPLFGWLVDTVNAGFYGYGVFSFFGHDVGFSDAP